MGLLTLREIEACQWIGRDEEARRTTIGLAEMDALCETANMGALQRQAAFVVVFENPDCVKGRSDQVLMLKHLKPEVEGKWGFPGGKVERKDFENQGPRTPYERAAVRELRQETDLDPHRDYDRLHAMPAVCASYPERGLYVTIHPFWTVLEPSAIPELLEHDAHSEMRWCTLTDEDNFGLPQPQIHPITIKVIKQALMMRNLQRSIRDGI